MIDAEQAAVMAIIHPDMDPNKAHGGIEKLWVKPVWHVFNAEYGWHDAQYDLARAGKLHAETSETVDLGLLRLCLRKAAAILVADLEAAGADLSAMDAALARHVELVAIARLEDFPACRIWGNWRWSEAAKE